MKENFEVKLRLNNDNKRKLVIINEIIEDYSAQGYTLTLRQLYYQLVTKNIIPNNTKEYGKLSNLLKKGRMAGIVDWDAIEDRQRIPKIPYSADDIPDALDDLLRQYRLDRMKNQDVIVEVWSEKDALSGILYEITSKYHVRLVINRGYSSITAIYDAYKRFKEAIIDEKKVYVLYFGDHDPSGLDMIRDIKERLMNLLMIGLLREKAEDMKNMTNDDEEFKEMIDSHMGWVQEHLSVIHVGLTYDQVLEFNPPPNPAKEDDPRSKGYKAQYGTSSWEVDALPPNILNELLTEAIEAEIALSKYEEILAQEEEDKYKLEKVKNKFNEGEV